MPADLRQNDCTHLVAERLGVRQESRCTTAHLEVAAFLQAIRRFGRWASNALLVMAQSERDIRESPGGGAFARVASHPQVSREPRTIALIAFRTLLDGQINRPRRPLHWALADSDKQHIVDKSVESINWGQSYPSLPVDPVYRSPSKQCARGGTRQHEDAATRLDANV